MQKNKNRLGYKKTPIGWIPDRWNLEQLDKLCTKIGSGITPKGGRDTYIAYGIPFIRSQNVQSAYFSMDGLAYITEAQHSKMLSTSVIPGDVLYNITGASIGRACCFPSYIQKANVNQHVCILRPNLNLNSYFLCLLLNCDTGKRQLYENQTGGGREGLNFENLGEFLIPLPSLPEQEKIAEILLAWDEAIANLAKLVEEKEKLKQGLMQQLLTGELRFSSDKSPWKKVRMGELLKRVFRPIEWTAEMQLSLVSLRRRCGGLFRRPDVLGADYKTQDLHELKSNDFLVSKRQVAHGAWALVPMDFEGSHVSKEYAIFVNKSPDNLHMPFFAWLAQTSRMIRLARVASTGVHIEKLIFDPEVFIRESIRIPPTVAEQKQIADALDVAQSEIVLLRTQRAAIDQQNSGLMQKLLTGEIRVKTQGVCHG